VPDLFQAPAREEAAWTKERKKKGGRPSSLFSPSCQEQDKESHDDLSTRPVRNKAIGVPKKKGTLRSITLD